MQLTSRNATLYTAVANNINYIYNRERVGLGMETKANNPWIVRVDWTSAMPVGFALQYINAKGKKVGWSFGA